MDKLLYTKREAAKLLSISEDTLDELRRSGKLNGYRIERGNPRVYFWPEELKLFADGLEVAVC